MAETPRPVEQRTTRARFTREAVSESFTSLAKALDDAEANHDDRQLLRLVGEGLVFLSRIVVDGFEEESRG